MWNFTKIPLESWSEFERLYESKDFTGLVLFHNKYNLSDYDYCCGEVDKKAVFKWAKFGLNGRREQSS
jgi:hypothetical protein